MKLSFDLALPLQKDRAGESESVVLMKPEPALLRRPLQHPWQYPHRFLFLCYLFGFVAAVSNYIRIEKHLVVAWKQVRSSAIHISFYVFIHL